jgi:hypothetical protein
MLPREGQAKAELVVSGRNLHRTSANYERAAFDPFSFDWTYRQPRIWILDWMRTGFQQVYSGLEGLVKVVWLLNLSSSPNGRQLTLIF